MSATTSDPLLPQQGAERFAESGDVSKLSTRNTQRIEIILGRLDAAKVPEHMNLPGLYFHALKGDEKRR